MTARSKSEGPVYSEGTCSLVSFSGVSRFSTSNFTSYLHKTVTDVVTPNYRSLIADGHIINNPCSITHSQRITGGGSYTASLKGDPETGSSVEGDGSVTHWAAQFGQNPFEYFEKANLSTSMTKAKLQALGNIDSTPYAFAEDIFEIRSTIRFIRDPLKSILKLVRQMKKKHRNRGSYKARYSASLYDMSKTSSDIWLTYRFALTPLVKSVMDAIEVLDNGLSDTPNLRRNARGKSEDNISSSDKITPAQFSFDRATTSKEVLRANILYQVKNPVTGVSRELGLRPSDIPETLWAIVPFSFMVDRVVDISGYIRAFTNLANPNVEILAASITRKYTDDLSVTVVEEDAPSYNVQLSGDTSFQSDGGYTREIWDPDISNLSVDFDVSGLVKDVTSIVDLLALIRAASR